MADAARRPEVIRIRTGFPVNCYLVRDDDGVVLVDCSMAGRTRRIERAMADHGVTPGDVRLILVTHSHADHAGGAAALRALTGAPVAVHGSDRSWIETGEIVVPPPVTDWGTVMAWVTRWLLVPFIHFPTVKPDIVLNDEDFDLAHFGVRGIVKATPGHTAGSVSVLLPGSVIVGDMAMNGFPFRRGAGLPAGADDFERLLDSWRLLFRSHEFDTVFPGHGDAFPAEILKQELDRPDAGSDMG